MPCHPHQPSDKTPEELAAQSARRLQNRIARALLKEDDAGDTAIDDAVRTLRDSCRDKAERAATRNHAAESLLREGNKAAGNLPSTTINQGVTLDAATLLSLVRDGGSSVPNSGSLVPSEIQAGLPTPTGDLQDAHRLSELGLPIPLESRTESATQPIMQDATPSAAPEVLRGPWTHEGDAEGAV